MRNPLNDPDHDGQSLGIGPKEDGVRFEDQYRCPACDELVEEHEFIHEMKVCRQCWEEKHGAGYVSIDQAEYLKGDR